MTVLRHGELAARIRAQPHEAAKLLEEVLRIDGPSLAIFRFTTEATTIGDLAVPAGTPVYLMIGAANFDPAVFAEPERLDIDRSNVRQHLALGHGIHTCLGQSIVRAVVPATVALVLEKCQHLRLADPLGTIACMGVPQEPVPVSIPSWPEPKSYRIQ